MKKYVLKNHAVYGAMIEIYCYAKNKKEAIVVFEYILEKLMKPSSSRALLDNTKLSVIANMERVR